VVWNGNGMSKSKKAAHVVSSTSKSGAPKLDTFIIKTIDMRQLQSVLLNNTDADRLAKNIDGRLTADDIVNAVKEQDGELYLAIKQGRSFARLLTSRFKYGVRSLWFKVEVRRDAKIVAATLRVMK
jgi:hypothetical protein